MQSFAQKKNKKKMKVYKRIKKKLFFRKKLFLLLLVTPLKLSSPSAPFATNTLIGKCREQSKNKK